MTLPVVVGFGLCSIMAAVLFVLWWGLDTDSRDHTERLAVIEAALNLGGQPQALVDEPLPTEPMPRVDLAGGRRTGVAAAREANRERPTPFPRANPAAVTDARESGRRGEPVWGRDRVSPRHRAARGKR